jgi:hypothetical protein
LEEYWPFYGWSQCKLTFCPVGYYEPEFGRFGGW